MYKELSIEEFKTKFLEKADNLEIIDVRQPEEFNQIRIKGSKLISMEDLGTSLNQIDWNKEVVFVCRTGSRSWYVTQILNQNGYEWKNLAGGINILRINCKECIEQGNLSQDYFN